MFFAKLRFLVELTKKKYKYFPLQTKKDVLLQRKYVPIV